jgi:hypothetical protein
MRQEHEVRTGDAATDKMVADEMKSSFESAGMRVTVTPMAGGGWKLVTEMELPPEVAAAAAAASATTGQAFSMNAYTLGGEERVTLSSSLESANLDPTLAYLTKTRASKEWDDRAFMLDLVAVAAPTEPLQARAKAAPRDANLRLLAGVHHFAKAWQARGRGTADTVTEEGALAMGDHLAAARADLEAAVSLDGADPTACAFLVGLAQLEGNDPEPAFKAAIARDSGHLAAYMRVVSATTEKWGGSRDLSLGYARKAVAAAQPGSDLPCVLFRAHLEGWFYRKRFQEDAAAAQAYLSSPQVRSETTAAFDRWITDTWQARRASIPGLHWAAAWFFLLDDRARCKRAMKLTASVQPDQMVPWCWISDMAYTQALQASFT